MLGLLFRGAARLLDVRLEDTEGSPQDEEAFSFDMNALGALLPSSDFPWRRMAGVYGQTISPMFKSIHGVLMEDADHITRLLSELEPLEEVDQNDRSKAPVPVSYPQHPFSPNTRHCREYPLPGETTPPDCYRKRRQSFNPPDHPVLIPSTHPSIPSILITPCAPSQCPSEARVPLQDASYGNKLAVPGYPHLNSCSAPLILKPAHEPLVERWKWREGHWWAIVPDLEVQRRKGWFSRPISARRRAARPCRTGMPCEESR